MSLRGQFFTTAAAAASSARVCTTTVAASPARVSPSARGVQRYPLPQNPGRASLAGAAAAAAAAVATLNLGRRTASAATSPSDDRSFWQRPDVVKNRTSQEGLGEISKETLDLAIDAATNNITGSIFQKLGVEFSNISYEEIRQVGYQLNDTPEIIAHTLHMELLDAIIINKDTSDFRKLEAELQRFVAPFLFDTSLSVPSRTKLQEFYRSIEACEVSKEEESDKKALLTLIGMLIALS